MRLGVIYPQQKAGADVLLCGLAARLEADGLRLAGTVQSNPARADGGRCDMDLRVLGGGPGIRISQSLGPGSRGCRLDLSALEGAVEEVRARITPDTDLVIINKFGKHEAEGRGFRPLIADALALGLPVLTAANALNRFAFDSFAAGLAETVPADPDRLHAWIDGVLGDQRIAV
ncbi:MAG: DUF2478 domain-containing protein [Roseicyclus sp.]|nr:DUF2478 domain-containing protein [Roseicyclus sp.]MBO6623755.1 DUF2478 domain-containing protein [Roseicyclus sp.]MBO6922287.1 DUF2478 domain-containing protein [Roseicyclus sp.]